METGEGKHEPVSNSALLNRTTLSRVSGESPWPWGSGPPWKGWAAGRRRRGGWKEGASASELPGETRTINPLSGNLEPKIVSFGFS